MTLLDHILSTGLCPMVLAEDSGKVISLEEVCRLVNYQNSNKIILFSNLAKLCYVYATFQSHILERHLEWLFSEFGINSQENMT